MTRQPPYPSLRDLTRFFLPLVFIAFSQSFTYPLVASVVSNGPMGSLEYEAYVIGQHVVTFLASTSFGLVTTGIVFATSRRANRNFTQLGLLLAAAAVISAVAEPVYQRVRQQHLPTQQPIWVAVQQQAQQVVVRLNLHL